MKKRFAALSAVLLLAACESTAWTAETCNNNLEADVEDFEEYKTQFRKAQEGLANAERTGNAANVQAFQKSVGEWKGNLETMLGFIDRDMIPECEGKFSPELLAKAEEVRGFVKGGTGTEEQKEEGMPDLRVTKIESAFIPVEFDPNGGCSGPYLELTYTVSNQGGDFPRPVDLEEYAKRAQQPPENLEFFNVYGELDFGNDSRTSADFEVKGGSDGMIKKGGSLKLKKKVRVEHNQTHAKAWGYVQSSALLKNGGNSVRHETAIDVPMWDVYAESHEVIDGIDPDTKKYYISTKGTVSNKGASPTPGPIRGSFVIYDASTRQQITSWSGETKGPVAGSEQIFARTYSTVKVPAKMFIQSSVVPVCPEGKPGSLADGDTKNNSRELKQAGGR
ncbi:MAG: hypothetical protein Q7R81_03835 [Candidatus Peregrinibacteria bacterium]|nr:hypothetical protein [Candidatus Peregrinibacteria bacterium]